jgi:hypothetical protein
MADDQDKQHGKVGDSHFHGLSSHSHSTSSFRHTKRNYNPATSGKSITAVSSNSVQSTASDIQEDVALAGALKEILEIVWWDQVSVTLFNL